MRKKLLSAIAMLLLLSGIALFASCNDDSTDDTHISVSSSEETDAEGTSSEITDESNDINEDETTSDTTKSETTVSTTGGENWSQDRK